MLFNHSIMSIQQKFKAGLQDEVVVLYLKFHNNIVIGTAVQEESRSQKGALNGGNTTRHGASFTYPTSTAGIISKKAPITKEKPGNTSLEG